MKNNKLKREDTSRVLIYCFAAFLLTMIGAIIAAAVNGIYPFGERSVLFGDLCAQYEPYLVELYDKLHSGGSLFYSFRTGLGGVFFGNALYYASSPFNIFLLFIDRTQISNFAGISIMIRQALAAFFMTYYLCRRKKGKADGFSCGCGLLYAFCGWFTAYYYNIIWLDFFWVLPILALGIERLIDENKKALYAFSFLYIFIANFYMAFFAALFVVIYSLIYFFTNYEFNEFTEDGKKQIKVPFTKTRFFRAFMNGICVTVLCVFACGIFLVPLVIQLSYGKEPEMIGSRAAWFANLTEQLSSYLSGTKANSVIAGSYANVYSGLISLIVLPLYLLSSKIPSRDKIIKTGFLVFLFLSFNIPFLDFIWHAFRYPSGPPFRQSFMVSFFLLSMAAEVLHNVKDIPKKHFIFSGAFVGIFLLFGAMNTASGENAIAEGKDVGISLLLAGLVTAVCIISVSAKKTVAVVCAALIPVLCFADGTYMLSSNIVYVDTPALSYAETDKAVAELMSKTEDGFYRTEMTPSWQQNDGCVFGYNGVRMFSSVLHSDILELLKNMGLDSNSSNYVEYYPQTPVFNSIFGVKYVLENKSMEGAATFGDSKNEGYEKVGTAANYDMFRYSYALPVGFTADAKIKEWTPSEYNAVKNQNDLMEMISSVDGVLVYSDDDAVVTPGSTDVTFSESSPHIYEYSVPEYPEADTPPSLNMDFTADEDGDMFVYFDMKEDKYARVYSYVIKPDGSAQTFITNNGTFMCDIGHAKKGDKYHFVFYLFAGQQGSVTARMFRADTDKLEKAYNSALAFGGLEVSEYTDKSLKGSIDVKEDNRVFCMSVPFDKGWEITVDGEKLPSEKIIPIGGALTGFELSKGEHDIAMEYHLEGLTPGIILSCVSLAAAVVWFVISIKKKNKAE